MLPATPWFLPFCCLVEQTFVWWLCLELHSRQTVPCGGAASALQWQEGPALTIIDVAVEKVGGRQGLSAVH